MESLVPQTFSVFPLLLLKVVLIHRKIQGYCYGAITAKSNPYPVGRTIEASTRLGSHKKKKRKKTQVDHPYFLDT